MKPCVILLVNADPEVDRVAKEAVTQAGHDLRTAHTSAEALQLLGRKQFDADLVILDLDPQIHGVALLTAIVACREKVPIIAMTNLEDNYMRPLALGRGAIECFGKPVTL